MLAALAFLLTRLAGAPRWVGDVLARAPALDLIVALFTRVPWLAGALRAGWAGFLGAPAGGRWPPTSSGSPSTSGPTPAP